MTRADEIRAAPLLGNDAYRRNVRFAAWVLRTKGERIEPGDLRDRGELVGFGIPDVLGQVVWRAADEYNIARFATIPLELAVKARQALQQHRDVLPGYLPSGTPLKPIKRKRPRQKPWKTLSPQPKLRGRVRPGSGSVWPVGGLDTDKAGVK